MSDVMHHKWWGWGVEGIAFHHEDKPAFAPFVYEHTAIDLSEPGQQPPRFEDITVPKSKVSKKVGEQLRAVVGDHHVFTDDMERVIHTYGKGLRDLVYVRAGHLPRVPDVVVYPANEAEVQQIVDLVEEIDAVLIPFGGGSNISGSLTPPAEEKRLVISMDMGRMNRVLEIDEVSGLARIQAGVLGPDMETQLNATGWTMGHQPDSFKHSTLGGWIATRARATVSVIAGRALITGGSAGIGLAFARALAARGVDLVLVSRTLAKLEEVATDLRRHGVEVEVIAADLATRAGVDAIAQRLAADPHINILVNNAGSGLHEPTVTVNTELHERGVDLMVTAPMLLASAAGLRMQERGRGLIINVGSVAGLIAMNNYSAIKAWMNTFSDALTLEMRGSGVHIMTLLPGWVRTEFHERANVNAGAVPSWLWLSADRLVADTLKAVEKGKNRVVPSKRFKILALAASYLPRPIVVWGTGMIKKGRDER